MYQFSYTAEAWAALAKNPQDRTQPLKELFEKIGGKFESLYYCFGDYDGVIIGEAPDDVAMTAGVLAAISPGHVRVGKTTRLMSVEEAMSAMRKAGEVAYPAPSGMR
jgi:uncharacterized protein with GYD domain